MATAPGFPETELTPEAREHLRKTLAGLDSHSAEFTRQSVSAITSALKSAHPSISKEELSSAVHAVIHTSDVVGRLPERARSLLRSYVPLEHTKQLAAETERHLAARSPWLAERLGAARTGVVSVASDPKVQTVAATGTAGAGLMGAGGGALGMAGGAMAGGAAGLLGAPFTFGLAIPVGAFLGGGAGAALGSALGAVTGLLGGSLVGRVGYSYRDELKSGAATLGSKAVGASSYAKDTAVHAGSRAVGVAKDSRVQAALATVTSALGGALAAGLSTGVAGLVMGGVAGGALGLIPAPLTFGLSIPVGAVLGGGAGGLLGALGGGTAGLLGGGATGYGVYRSRHSIRGAALGVMSRAQEAAKPVTSRVTAMVGGGA